MTPEDDTAITLNEIARLAVEWEERAVDSERRCATTMTELGAVALMATARVYRVASLELQRVLGGALPVPLADHHEVAPIWKFGCSVDKNVPAELWVITSPTMGAPTSVADVLGTEADALRVAARLNERQEDGASDWTVVPYVRRGAPPSCSEGNDG